MNWIK